MTSAIIAFQLLIADTPVATALLCVISMTRTILLIVAEKKYKRLNHWLKTLLFLGLYIGVFFATIDFDTAQWFHYIALVGSCFLLTAVYFTDMRVTKVLLMVGIVMWMTFYVFTGMYTLLIGEAFNLAANIIALTTIIKARKANEIPLNVGKINDPSPV